MALVEPPHTTYTHGVMVDPQSLNTVRSLVTEGLKAGGFLKGDGRWEPYQGVHRLRVKDVSLGKEREGAVIAADTLTAPLLMSLALNDLRILVIIGRTVSKGVDLGKIRAERLRHSADMGTNYWAVYVIEDGTLVSLGSPFSSSRLVGEILHAQTGHAFEQRRVCAQCGELNAYKARFCVRCNERLVATGRLNRWMHYDNEETAVRDLTPEEEKKLAESIKAKIATIIHPWKAETVKRSVPDEIKDAVPLNLRRDPLKRVPERTERPVGEQDVRSLLSAPTMPIKRRAPSPEEDGDGGGKVAPPLVSRPVVDKSRALETYGEDETIPPGRYKLPPNSEEETDQSSEKEESAN